MNSTHDILLRLTLISYDMRCLFFAFFFGLPGGAESDDARILIMRDMSNYYCLKTFLHVVTCPAFISAEQICDPHTAEFLNLFLQKCWFAHQAYILEKMADDVKHIYQIPYMSLRAYEALFIDSLKQDSFYTRRNRATAYTTLERMHWASHSKCTQSDIYADCVANYIKQRHLYAIACAFRLNRTLDRFKPLLKSIKAQLREEMRILWERFHHPYQNDERDPMPADLIEEFSVQDIE